MSQPREKPPWKRFGGVVVLPTSREEARAMNPFASHARTEPRPNRFLPQVAIPAERAYMCMSCDTIHTSARCPHCDKGPSVPLSKWLNRKEGRHSKDEDCASTLDNTGTCRVCGTYHGKPCEFCGKRGFHMDNCPGPGLEEEKFNGSSKSI